MARARVGARLVVVQLVGDVAQARLEGLGLGIGLGFGFGFGLGLGLGRGWG